MICAVLFSKPLDCRYKPKLGRNDDKIQSVLDKIPIGVGFVKFDIRIVI